MMADGSLMSAAPAAGARPRRGESGPNKAVQDRIDQRRPIGDEEREQSEQQRLLHEPDEDVFALQRPTRCRPASIQYRHQKQNPRRRRREMSGTCGKHCQESVQAASSIFRWSAFMTLMHSDVVAVQCILLSVGSTFAGARRPCSLPTDARSGPRRSTASCISPWGRPIGPY